MGRHFSKVGGYGHIGPLKQKSQGARERKDLWTKQTTGGNLDLGTGDISKITSKLLKQ